MKRASPEVVRQIQKRRTFAIISHPDAGKTTITEKLLLFGNAIVMAGMVKAKRSKHFATSDWLEIEKQRGISVTSSVMQFPYQDYEINLLDTPGHEDFSEDTYRVLTAVDSVLMVIDSTKGIETQTKKLFQVCRERNLPIMTFMNKMDLEGRDPFELMDEIEKVLSLPCVPMTWPVGQGKDLKGIYHLADESIRLFQSSARTLPQDETLFHDLNDPGLINKIGLSQRNLLKEHLELLHIAGDRLNTDIFLKGQQSPVFFGSAIKNFGIKELLESFLRFAPSPRPRAAEERVVEPEEASFSGVVFKIQANMDPKHRDRTAFVRIVSGEFIQGMDLYHVREDRRFKINHAIVFLSQERETLDRAYAGDIIGIKERGNLIIGDTITQGESLSFRGIPQFSPDLFCRVELRNPLKNKQLIKGLAQLAEEGSSQMFRRSHNSDTILGVVGQLQLEVVKFRLLNEYGADANFIPLQYEYSRWFTSKNKQALAKFEDYHMAHIVIDTRGYPLILLKNEWEKDYIEQNNPEISFFSSLVQMTSQR